MKFFKNDFGVLKFNREIREKSIKIALVMHLFYLTVRKSCVLRIVKYAPIEGDNRIFCSLFLHEIGFEKILVSDFLCRQAKQHTTIRAYYIFAVFTVAADVF